MHTLASGSGAPRRRSLLSRLALVSLLSFYIANWLRWLTWSERLESQTTKYFGPLGWTAFGGPSANIVLIRKVSLALPSASPQSRIADTRRRAHQIFVTKQEWVDDQTFNDLLALGNALPGPAFSQVSSMSGTLLVNGACGDVARSSKLSSNFLLTKFSSRNSSLSPFPACTTVLSVVSGPSSSLQHPVRSS